MTATSLAALRWSLLAGTAAAALSASSLVAWHFSFAPQLGRPLVWHLYDPSAVVRWAWRWWHDPVWRGEFLSALVDPAIVALAPLGVVRLLDLKGWLPGGARQSDAGLGTARALARTGRVAAGGDGIVLGLDDRGRVQRQVADDHVLGEGPPGSGKTACVAVPTLLTWRGSTLVYDPKGEMAKVTGRFRSVLGPTFIIDPTAADPTATACYNPLLEIRDGPHLVADCQAVALVLAGSVGESAADQFWARAAAQILTALLITVRTSPAPTVAHLWSLVEGLGQARYPGCPHPSAAAAVAAHAQSDRKLRDSIDRTMAVNLAVLGDPLLHRVGDRSDFRAADLQAAERPVSVFLTVRPSHAERLRPYTRLVVQSLGSALLEEPRRTADGRAKRHDLLLLLDEFPQLGRLDLVERALPVCRGYGVRALLLCQDRAQVRSAYGKDESISRNCGTRVAIPGPSEETLAGLRDLAGHHRVTRITRQGAAGLGAATRTDVLEPVLTNAELLERARDEVLVTTSGCRPTYLRKAYYFATRAFAGLWDDPEGPLLVPSGGKPAPATVAPPAPASVAIPAAQAAALRSIAKPGESVEMVATRLLAAAAGKAGKAGTGAAPTP